MPKRVHKPVFVLILAFIAASLACVGCFNNTSVGPAAADDPYPARSCPDSVLRKLNLAYAGMDLDAYMDCLADSFFFYLRFEDCDDPWDPLPSHWRKSTERTIHHRMFGVGDTTGADGIDLALTTVAAEFDAGVPGDPFDNRWTYVVSADLRLMVSGWIFLATTDQKFVFAIEPGRADTLWTITEWYELSDEESGRVEDSSWGSIKGIYRIFR